MLTQQDIEQINAYGLSSEKVEKQINYFKNGFPSLDIIQPAKIGSGIVKMDAEQEEHYVKQYQDACHSKKIVKFVPASGAATRMFKDLFVFLEKYPLSNVSFEDFIALHGLKSVAALMKDIKKAAFYHELAELYTHDGDDIEKHIADKDYIDIVKKILLPEGLGYGSLPKGLISFHKYPKKARKAAEEQLVEGAMYAVGSSRDVNIHFTVSPEHEVLFDALVRSVRPEVEKEFHIKLDASYSTQKKSTDTIAVDMDNAPFRKDDGSLVFRPGGHGALIENLNTIDADIIFIKNIDNVVPDRLKEPTVVSKQALAGLLLEIQEMTHRYRRVLDMGIMEESMKPLEEFVEGTLCHGLPSAYATSTFEEKKEYMRGFLNRPIRVCGMVKNEGEPGGGPFWVRDIDGSVSLQIVESAQIDLSDPDKKAIFDASTHFNPVDLVCAVRDYQGKKIDLDLYIDHNAGFISKKSMSGKDLKALELPGLWNGAMSRWITVFVEVPIETFNPVKTVNDLLRPAHQGE
ncbi:MAG: DUF4301 family protein [Flavobacteriales bacterium]|nr:DUF4301 family protein [Flavobacteriales bacterium]